MSYTDAEILCSVGQVETYSGVNPAVLVEHEQLKEAALRAVRSWFAMNLAERAFKGTIALNKTASELLEFEGRHGLFEASDARLK